MREDPPIDRAPPPPNKWVSNRFVRVLIRTVRTWIQSFLAIAALQLSGQGALMVGGVAYIPVNTAGGMLTMAAYVALWPAGFALLQNLLEELARLDPGTKLRG